MLCKQQLHSAHLGKCCSSRLIPHLMHLLQGLYSCGLSLYEQILQEKFPSSHHKEHLETIPLCTRCQHRLYHVSSNVGQVHWPAGFHSFPFPSFPSAFQLISGLEQILDILESSSIVHTGLTAMMCRVRYEVKERLPHDPISNIGKPWRRHSPI